VTRPFPHRPTWAHPIGWLGFALGLACSLGLIHLGRISAPPLTPYASLRS
jgi:hypothetical protein